MIALRVENLCKSYRIAHQASGAGYRTLREEMLRIPKVLLSKLRPAADGGPSGTEEFQALRNISFDVSQGEVVGIVGRNGAGKSTLLKILSRITEPTSGRVPLYGRVASLLEVGTGFHPELTGRENIFLNGAILGMSRSEIKAKFDEIVAFAEVERFLDTPVKRYSSGMYVRLAFAVAAHLEPEILIVDEVLAVGDAEFQKKCLGKMQEVGRGGRTVLFVSHNMGAVASLCTRALLLKHGSLLLDDVPAKVVAKYLESGSALTQWKREDAIPEADGIYFHSVNVLVDGKPATEQISTDHEIVVEMVVQAQGNYRDAEIAVRFTNQQGVTAFTTANSDRFDAFQPIKRGRHVFRAHIPPYLLAAGTYSLVIAALVPDKTNFQVLDGEIQFEVHELGPQASATADHRWGVVNPRLAWDHAAGDGV